MRVVAEKKTRSLAKAQSGIRFSPYTGEGNVGVSPVPIVEAVSSSFSSVP